ncbi:hypothetical protein RQP46_009774 [Phenoliferia psychrophenolica]
MPPMHPSKPVLIPLADLEWQLACLKGALAPTTPAEARARLRGVCDWAVANGKGITIDVLNAVPGGSPGARILKVALGIAMLRRDAEDAAEACSTLKDRLLVIYQQSYELRKLQQDPIDGEMDA